MVVGTVQLTSDSTEDGFVSKRARVAPDPAPLVQMRLSNGAESSDGGSAL